MTLILQHRLAPRVILGFVLIKVFPSLFLPSSLQEPTTSDLQGQPLLAFGRVLLGRSNTLRVSLKNNGQLAGSSRLELEPHPAFSLSSK